MTTIETDAEKNIRKAAKAQMKQEKKRQVTAFARDVLGSDKNQSKAFRKIASRFFKLDDDGLKFKGMGNKLVAVGSDQSVDFFRKEFPFLMKQTAAAAAEHGAPDAALLAAARAGNRTAYSRLARDLFNGDIKALDAMLADKGQRDDKVANGHDDKPLPGFEGSKNPFYRLRKDGKIDKKVEAQIGDMIRVMGHKAVQDIARAAKSPTAPLGLSLTGIPLRP